MEGAIDNGAGDDENIDIEPSMHYFTEEQIDYIINHFKEILRGDSYLSQYIYCRQFEGEFSSFHGSNFGISCSSGTAALELIFQALDVSGKEVIIPTNTFAATAFAVIKAGGLPVFADINKDLMLDPKSLNELISERTAAVCTVHIGGAISSNIEEISKICEENDVNLVEDAAHAHGSSLKNQYAGNFGDAAAFSLYSTKVMTTGEGGIVATDCEEIRDKMMSYRNHSKSKDSDTENHHYDMGYNLRMTEIQGLLGIAQLEDLNKFIKMRANIAEIYNNEFENAKGVFHREIPSNSQSNYYKYILFLEDQEPKTLSNMLKQSFGISLPGSVYRIPLHKQPVFEQYDSQGLTSANALCASHVCLPIYPQMSDEEAMYVAKSVKASLAE